ETRSALKAFRDAARRDPAAVAYVYNQALALNALGRRLDALAACLAALDIDAAYHLAWQFRGQLHRDRDELAQARDCFREEARVAPSARAFTDAGWAAWRLEDRAGALEAFRGALDLEPANAEVLRLCGQLTEIDDPTAAADYYRRALEADP